MILFLAFWEQCVETVDMKKRMKLGLPRFPVPEPGNSVVPGTREPGIWSGSKTVPGQAFLGKNYV